MQLTATIDHLAWTKIMFWVRHAKGLEVSGFGKIIRTESNLHVVDAFLLKQVNSPMSTDLDAHDIGRKMFQKKDEPGDFNFWWHSHHSMAAYFSKTDYDTIQELGENGWLLATVFNNRGETKSATFVRHPVPHINENLELQVLPLQVPEAFQTELTRQYDEAVEVKTFAPVVQRDAVDRSKWTSKQWKRYWRQREREGQRLLIEEGTLPDDGFDEEDEEQIQALIEAHLGSGVGYH